MARIEKSRREIEKGINDTGKKMKEKHDKLKRDIKDKKIVSDAAHRTRLKGTSEGERAVKGEVAKAGQEVGKETKKHAGELKGVHSKEAKPREKNLEGRKRETQKDTKDLKSARGQVEAKGAKRELAKAADDARKDADYLAKTEKKQAAERKRSEIEGKRQLSQVQATRIKFRN